VGTTVPGVMALEASANVAQYWLTEYTSGRRPTWGGTALSAGAGAVAGWIGRPYTSIDIGFDLTSTWLDQHVLKEMLRAEVRRTVRRQFPRSLAATMISNVPDLLPSLASWR